MQNLRNFLSAEEIQSLFHTGHEGKRCPLYLCETVIADSNVPQFIEAESRWFKDVESMCLYDSLPEGARRRINEMVDATPSWTYDNPYELSISECDGGPYLYNVEIGVEDGLYQFEI